MDWLIVFIGIVIGAVVTAYVFCRNFVGTLRVDRNRSIIPRTGKEKSLENGARKV